MTTAREAGRDAAATRILALVETTAELEEARSRGAEARLRMAAEAPGERWLGTAGLDDIAALRPSAGVSTLVVDASPGRLLDAMPYPRLAVLADGCRAGGLKLGLAGALEAADVPRLLPLRPAFLVFDTALRGERGLDGERLGAILRLLRPAAAGPVRGVPDRVFIRDFVQEMEIGAYASERGRRQRVRFSLEAELAPVKGPRSLADIYSYDRMMDAVRALCDRSPEAFVETLAEDLADEILADPRVRAVRVRVEKLDLGPGAAGVEIRRPVDGMGPD